MSFATRMWARKFASTASNRAFLRPSIQLKNYKPLRTMATAAKSNAEETFDFQRTTITEDTSFGCKCLE
ncbi:hypothetical protein G6F58_010999 [Rhizopus delemar]|jgi:hypothetical protein|nr:hypothetical protein G6F58_010999 [Rhizopus delemar]